MAPGPGGFGGAFYMFFWKYLKWIVVGAIKEIYLNWELPLSQRLGIIARPDVYYKLETTDTA